MITCIKDTKACKLSICEYCNPTPQFILEFTSLGRMVLVPNPEYKNEVSA